MEQLNQLHMSIAKKVPGNFDGDEDFVIATCRMGISAHLLQKKLGLAGFSPNLQIAWYNFCSDVARTMIKESGPIGSWPDSFQGMVDFSDHFINIDFEKSEIGHQVSEALIAQFVERWSPFSATNFIFREMILAFLPDQVLDKQQLGTRRPWVEFFILLFFKVMVFIGSIMPDPKTETFPIFRNSRKNKEL